MVRHLRPGRAPQAPPTKEAHHVTVDRTRNRTVRRVVVVGDSVTTGTASDSPGFPHELGLLLSQRLGHPVDVINLGLDGHTARALRWQLRLHWRARRSVASADVVVVTVGANDLVPVALWRRINGRSGSYVAPARRAAHGVAAVVRLVRQVARATRVPVLVTTYWNVFGDGRAVTDPVQRAWNDRVTLAFNSELKVLAGAAGAVVVDLYEPFKAGGSSDPSDLLAADGEHPSPAGHRLIAKSVAGTVLDLPVVRLP